MRATGVDGSIRDGAHTRDRPEPYFDGPVPIVDGLLLAAHYQPVVFDGTLGTLGVFFEQAVAVELASRGQASTLLGWLPLLGDVRDTRVVCRAVQSSTGSQLLGHTVLLDRDIGLIDSEGALV